MAAYQTTNREHALIIAALRYFQRFCICPEEMPDDVADIIAEAGEPLKLSEIDDLIEELNYDDSSGPRITKCCETCGSTSILADGYAAWDEDAQVWKVASIMDDGHYCETCNAERGIVDKAIDA